MDVEDTHGYLSHVFMGGVGWALCRQVSPTTWCTMSMNKQLFFQYFLRSAFNPDKLLRMQPVVGKNCLYEARFVLDYHSRDEFTIVRDRDLKQVFHMGSDGSVSGPSDLDDLTRLSHFAFHGEQNCLAKVQLSFTNGRAIVSCETQGSVLRFA